MCAPFPLKQTEYIIPLFCMELQKSFGLNAQKEGYITVLKMEHQMERVLPRLPHFPGSRETLLKSLLKAGGRISLKESPCSPRHFGSFIKTINHPQS